MGRGYNREREGGINPRSLEENRLHEHLRGEGGGQSAAPSTFDTIHPIDMIFSGGSKEGGFRGLVSPPPPSFRKFFFTKVKFCWQKLVLNEYKICLKVLEMALLDIQIFKSLRRSLRLHPLSPFKILDPPLIFDIYNKLPLYFQLRKTTWCLVGFHGNQSYINDVKGHHLGFSKFQIVFKFEL